MLQSFRLGDFQLYWLEGGFFELDGGSLFGVVPRVLWQKKCAATPDNYVQVVGAPILVRTPAGNILIETGLGNKLTEKQKKIFRLRCAWNLPSDLESVGISRQEIEHVVLTHGDFDHAGGITMYDTSGELTLTFPNATHYIQRWEWEDVQAPNRRAASSYWAMNFAGLAEGRNLFFVDREHEVVPGVGLFHTGGHTRGHQAVRLASGGEQALHLGDLLPTPAFANPLWITPYDNFPLDSIAVKEKIMVQGIEEGIWFTFYHDQQVLACIFDGEGNVKTAIISGRKPVCQR
jgi:glyoxylase-like metal-dependent hydrolase (beta-lactamase superfamily II)